MTRVYNSLEKYIICNNKSKWGHLSVYSRLETQLPSVTNCITHFTVMSSFAYR